jgi:hypothetical protein
LLAGLVLIELLEVKLKIPETEKLFRWRHDCAVPRFRLRQVSLCMHNLTIFSVSVPAADLIESTQKYCAELLAICTLANAFDALWKLIKKR